MKSKNNYFSFEKMEKEKLDGITSKRPGETKLGETFSTLKKAKYVILGIEESIGPRANMGRGGAEYGFAAFLNTFLNMQANETLDGDAVHVLGRIHTTNKTESDNLREEVSELDDFVIEVLNDYLTDSQVPIVIGGGHNNAYPLIKYAAKRKGKPLQVVNLDAHADYRLLEGRHSGNSFSYGYRDGFIGKYHVFGLHQRYNSQQIIEDLRRDNHSFTFNESYVFGDRNYLDDFNIKVKELISNEGPVGIELDMDTIERMPSSAYSPVGLSIDMARNYIHVFGKLKNVAYLHIPEGAPTNEKEIRIVGKVLSYLVSDFIQVNGN